jgi:hypothetical protein
MSDHDCPGGCGRPVPYQRFACGPCWYRLPVALRRAITSGWAHRADDPAVHRRAMTDATEWYRDQGGQPR